MALIPRPPHTGNDELDSVLTYLVDRINDGVTQPGTGPQGPPGEAGPEMHGNYFHLSLHSCSMLKSLCLRGLTDVDYDFSDINAPVTVNSVENSSMVY